MIEISDPTCLHGFRGLIRQIASDLLPAEESWCRKILHQKKNYQNSNQ
jgi:hypothetical protein